MTRKVDIDGQSVWCKTYDGSPRGRRAVAVIWNALVRRLRVPPLASPSRPSGDQARQLEQRRIETLHGQGVRVPKIVGHGKRILLLGDLGPSLSGRLKQAADTDTVDADVQRCVTALADVHRRGAYLGQAVARNIVVTEAGVGFIDFEEDPLEVMSLVQAQTRDWLLFASSIGRHYANRTHTLAGMFGRALPQVGTDVAETVDAAARRLGFVERLTARLGERASALGVAVAALRESRAFWALAFVFVFDFVGDGDSDILLALQQLL